MQVRYTPYIHVVSLNSFQESDTFIFFLQIYLDSEKQDDASKKFMC
jgi:hypothetical protein